jgi:glycosidase
VARHLDYFPADFLMPTFLDNHDMDRFLYVADGDKGALRRAAEVQMRLPGPPIIYYGTEVGMSQPTSKHGGLTYSRLPMPWDGTQDKDMLAFYQQLIRKRRNRS